jgi:hypothetical protein
MVVIYQRLPGDSQSVLSSPRLYGRNGKGGSVNIPAAGGQFRAKTYLANHNTRKKPKPKTLLGSGGQRYIGDGNLPSPQTLYHDL